MRKLEVQKQVMYLVAKQKLYQFNAPSNTHTHIPTSILSSEVVLFYFWPMPRGLWDLYLDQGLNLSPSSESIEF